MILINKPSEKALDALSCEDAKRRIKEGYFALGSMLPEIEACIDFFEHTVRGSEALITSLEKAKKALYGKTGTRLYK